MSSKKKNRKETRKNTRQASKTTCRALIPLNTKKIRNGLLKTYKRRKKVLERIEAQLEQYNENDEPEFQKFLALRFGAEQTRLRELAEKFSLVQMRREKLRFMAHEEGIPQGKYCAYLESKVTPETDFWAVLENEIMKMQEEQRRLDEEFERYCQGDNEWDNDCDNEDDDDDIPFLYNEFEEGFDEDFEETVEKNIKSIFGHLFGDIFPDTENHSADNEMNLKKLYRELCLRYHPDKTGEHDVKTRRLWLSIQAGYHAGDLSRLRAIHAGIEIESGNTDLVCSDIDAMIGDIEWSIHMTRNQLRNTKKTPYWGFSVWPAKRRKQVEQELAESYRYELEMAEHQLRKREAEIKRIRNSYHRKKKKTQMQNQPDLFQLDLPF